MLNVLKIRQDFPILKRKIKGKPLIYLDSAASSLKPYQVIKAMEEYYQNFGVNIFRGLYKISQEATFAYERAREKVAQFIGARSEKEIIFTRNTTEAINLVAYSWGTLEINKENEIILTVMEHHANLLPWQHLAAEGKGVIKYLEINNEGKLPTTKEIVAQISNKTKLLAITHVSNVLGTINPIKEIIKEIKRKNPKCLVLVDGAQAVPHFKINVLDLGCDFYAFSGHKMLGPMGIGVLWGRYELLKEIPPFQLGGEMIKEVYFDKAVFADPPTKFEAGTPNIAGAIGLGEAIDYLNKIGITEIKKYEEELTAYTLLSFSHLEDLTIYGPKKAKDRAGLIAFNLKGIHPHDLAQVLDEDNICLRSGHHCAMPLHQYLGISSSARVSFYLYNTKEEIDKLIEGLKKAKKIFHR